MILRSAAVIKWGLGAGGALLGTLLSLGASELWAAKADHDKDINTLKANAEGTRELLRDVRDDQKEMRQDIKELIRRTR